MAQKRVAGVYDFTVLDDFAAVVAPRLLGSEFVSHIDGETVRVRIVETEAYDQTDVASHSYKGQTPRSKVMFGPAGHLYVYFTYGMHYCANIVTGADGHGSAVLIRAVEPLEGEEFLRRRRNMAGVNITNGPAKFCQALGIDTTFNGHNLHQSPLELIINNEITENEIITTTRIGISQGKDAAWRFYIKDNPYVSRK